MYKVYKNIERLLVLLSRYISKSFLRYGVLFLRGEWKRKGIRTGLVDRINDGGNEALVPLVVHFLFLSSTGKTGRSLVQRSNTDRARSAHIW